MMKADWRLSSSPLQVLFLPTAAFRPSARPWLGRRHARQGRLQRVFQLTALLEESFLDWRARGWRGRKLTFHSSASLFSEG